MIKRNMLKKINQTGSMMIEALAMLTLISLVTPTLYKKSAERTTELQDINTATHVRTFIKALENYTSTNYPQILDQMKKDDISAALVDETKLAEFLPYGYDFKAVKTFDKPIALVKKQEGESDAISSIVIFPKIGDVNDLRASRIASMIGANGGYIDKNGSAKGVGGIWGLTPDELQSLFERCDECSSKATDGSLIATSIENINEASRAGNDNVKYLQRTLTENEEWRNTMMTDLYMGGTKNILKGGEIIPMSNIKGVNQLIIGGIEAGSRDEREASLVVRAYEDDGKEGSVFIEGSLRALNGKLTVSEDKLNFNDLLQIDGEPEGVPNIFIGSKDNNITVGDPGIGLNNDVMVTGTLTSKGDTHLATNGGTFRVGSSRGDKDDEEVEAEIINAESDVMSFYRGQMVLDRDSSILNINTDNVNITGDTAIGEGNVSSRFEDTKLNVQGNTFVSGKIAVGNGNATPQIAEDPTLDVQGNAYVSNKLEANELDAHNFNTLELHAGANNFDEEYLLNVDKDLVRVQDTDGQDRLVAGYDERYNTDATSLYGPMYDGDQGSINMGDTAIDITGIEETNIQTKAGGTVNIQGDTVSVANKSVTSNADQFLVKKGNQKLLNIVSGNNGYTLTNDAVAEIDPERFRIWANSTNGNNINNRIFEVNASSGEIKSDRSLSSPASVYIRRGGIEVESMPTPAEGETNYRNYLAEEGVGYIQASRLVANNLQHDGHTIVQPQYTPSSGHDSGRPIDRYMVNPAYTSVMHDIKLTTRGGARLSDILPDFINKGIYIVNNTYKDDVNFNNLSISTDNNQIRARNATNAGNSFNQWASPFLGMIPAPQCPPGHARVITITPASFQMSQTGNMVYSDGRWHVKEQETVNHLASYPGFNDSNQISSPIMQDVIVQKGDISNPVNLHMYYLGMAPDTSVSFGHEARYTSDNTPKPLYFQQSTWLKTKVVPYNANGKCTSNTECSDFLGWAAVMGFLYPTELYGPVIDSLSINGTEDSTVYWNVFPVRARSMEAYATVYCYFDRTNIFNSGNDSRYVDQYDQINNFRDIYHKSNANTFDKTGGKSNNGEYIKRLNDPQLKYTDPW